MPRPVPNQMLPSLSSVSPKIPNLFATQDIELFGTILESAIETTAAFDGRLYFIYLPEWLSLTRSHLDNPNRRQVLALVNGLKVVTQKDLTISETADFVISYMYRHLVKSETLAMARRAALNFHAGPLPEYGGWAFYNLAILESASEYGCTCHFMDEGFDTGPLFKVKRFPIDASQETAYSL